MNRNQKQKSKINSSKRGNSTAKKESSNDKKLISSTIKKQQKSIEKKPNSNLKIDLQEKSGEKRIAPSSSSKKRKEIVKTEPIKEEPKSHKKSPQTNTKNSKEKSTPKNPTPALNKKEKNDTKKEKTTSKKKNLPKNATKDEPEKITEEIENEEIQEEPAHEDDKHITQDIEQVLKKIEDRKKRKKTEEKFLNKKRTRKDETTQKFTAKDYGYILQKNPNFKREHTIDLFNLAKNQIISTTDCVLALVEIAHNSDYYQLAYSNKSKMFWEDILNYKILAKIFEGYKAETLRKYWRILSKYVPSKIKILLEKHKSFLESMPIKMLTIVTSVSLYFENKIKDIEKYISDIQIDVRKQEIFQEEYKDPETGLITTVKDVRTTIKKRKKYEPGLTKQFIKTEENKKLDEIYAEGKKETPSDYQKLIHSLNEEKSSQMRYLKQFNEEEKKKVLGINEDDKLAFKVIDLVLDGYCREFKQFSRDFILENFIANSMDPIKTYQSLKDQTKKR